MNMNNYLPFITGLSIMCFITICIESTQKMNNQNNEKSGFFLAHDKYNTPIIIEWHKTNIVSPDFAAYMKTTWDFARDAYISVEMDFLKSFPEVVGAESYFASFEPLFAQGIGHVDWDEAEKIMENILKGHFIFDPSQFPKHVVEMFSQDTVFFVSIKEEKTKTILGFITFLMRNNYTTGDIKVMSLAVDVKHQKRGLGKLLMSSIFRIIPDIKRIFLCTRVTNTIALNAYRAWGFVIDENPILDHAFTPQHWTFMEYKTEQCTTLQETAKKFIK